MTAESFSTSGTTSSTAKFALYITIRADAERKEDSGLGWNELREKQKEGKKERKKVSKKERKKVRKKERMKEKESKKERK